MSTNDIPNEANRTLEQHVDMTAVLAGALVGAGLVGAGAALSRGSSSATTSVTLTQEERDALDTALTDAYGEHTVDELIQSAADSLSELDNFDPQGVIDSIVPNAVDDADAIAATYAQAASTLCSQYRAALIRAYDQMVLAVLTRDNLLRADITHLQGLASESAEIASLRSELEMVQAERDDALASCAACGTPDSDAVAKLQEISALAAAVRRDKVLVACEGTSIQDDIAAYSDDAFRMISKDGSSLSKQGRSSMNHVLWVARLSESRSNARALEQLLPGDWVNVGGQLSLVWPAAAPTDHDWYALYLAGEVNLTNAASRSTAGKILSVNEQKYAVMGLGEALARMRWFSPATVATYPSVTSKKVPSNFDGSTTVALKRLHAARLAAGAVARDVVVLFFHADGNSASDASFAFSAVGASALLNSVRITASRLERIGVCPALFAGYKDHSAASSIQLQSFEKRPYVYQASTAYSALSRDAQTYGSARKYAAIAAGSSFARLLDAIGGAN